MMKIPISFLLFLLSSISTSDAIFTSKPSIGRNLLQASKPCPVNFEFANYTIITSQCKPPQYPPKPCCDAFKQFACPYFDELNDLSTDCSSRMFSYINLYGNYTVGLFANLCRDDKIGLICPASPPTEETDVNNDSNKSPNIHRSSIPPALTAGFLILFLWI